jgi:hypothetical protein
VTVYNALSLDEVGDRIAIRELIDTYAHCLDRRDAEGRKELFTASARFAVFMDVDSSEPSQEFTSRDELLPVFDALNDYQATTHFTGQSVIHIDGTRATGETYCIAYHLSVADGERTMTVASVRYLDTFAKQDNGGWLFAERRLMVDWTETRPSQP